MSEYNSLDKAQLTALLASLNGEYQEFKNRKINISMARGIPCNEQLDLSTEMLSYSDYLTSNGTDCRNYGMVDGIPEAKELFSKYLGVNTNEIIIGGNSSLSMMYDTIARFISFGAGEGSEPWGRQKIKFLCPSPGYDRHFAICELFGIEMIVIPMDQDGPDMDLVEKIVNEDESVKGIWCVPKYSNPEGIIYSDEVVLRLAKMKTKASDFRIFWDNAYAVHHLTDTPSELMNILEACKEHGSEDRVLMFGSTSKITFSGAGIGVMGSSVNNINYIKKLLTIQTIGPDKLNQLRHAKFFKTIDGVNEHMKKHAQIIKPKFDLVIDLFKNELGGKGIASWSEPKGGYFISLNAMDGCAKRIVDLAKNAGVVLTGAGATYPYGKDPKDSNIRIAPTYPSLEDLHMAMSLVCLCVKIASVEKLLL